MTIKHSPQSANMAADLAAYFEQIAGVRNHPSINDQSAALGISQLGTARRMKPQKHIYFMRPIGMLGPIKIGCSKFVDERLSSMASWSPYPLEVILSFPGTETTERSIHRCFADLRSHKEWFHAGKRLLDAIDAIKAGASVEDAIGAHGVARRVA